jgi:RNA polymerase sporulation-specific sigma factor
MRSPTKVRAGTGRGFSSSQSTDKPATAEENRAFLERYKAGDVTARDDLIVRNMPLVAWCLTRFRVRPQDWDDLMSEGALGLYKAIEKYDPERSRSFATCAYWYINARIQKWFARQPLIPGKWLSKGPIREKAEFAEGPVVDSVGDSHTLDQFGKGKEDDDSIAEREERVKVVRAGLETLIPAARAIIKKQAGIGCPKQTYQQIGDELGVSKQAAQQCAEIHRGKLRAWLLERSEVI